MAVTVKAAGEDQMVLTVEESAQFLGISRSAMYELLKNREVESFRIGRLRRVLRRDIAAYVEERRSEGVRDGAA